MVSCIIINNRNKVYNKYNALEPSQNHLPYHQSMEKRSSTKLVPGTKKVGDHCCNICLFSFAYLFFQVCFIDYAITVVPILFPLLPSTQYPLPSSNSPLSSCPWVMGVSSLASPFPILFLTSPCLFCFYQACFLIPALILFFSPFPLPADNSLNDPHTFASC